MPFDANEGSEESQDNVERGVLHGYAGRFNMRRSPAVVVAGGVPAFP